MLHFSGMAKHICYNLHCIMINEWNKLPNDCVNASSVNMFKNRIDRYLIRAGYT